MISDPTICQNCGYPGYSCMSEDDSDDDGDYECRHCGNEWNVSLEQEAAMQIAEDLEEFRAERIKGLT